MERKVVITDDGSSSIYIPEWDESYHSKHGAIQEAYHVFIKNGLDTFKNGSKISILEIGFGTGLNCFITFLECQKRNLIIDYVGIEAFPLVSKELKQLNYVEKLAAQRQRSIFENMHSSPWEKQYEIERGFSLLKRNQNFTTISNEDEYDLIYFDAFGPRVQPELWTEEIFGKMFVSLCQNGRLVTYSAKGSVRRGMTSVGFTVEKLPGPPGKREMLRAWKY